VGLEAAASVIRTYQIQIIPGLLQTEATPARLIRQGSAATEEEIARRGELRASRQESSAGRTRRSCGGRGRGRAAPPGGQPGGRPRAARAPQRGRGSSGRDLQILPFSAGAHSAMAARSLFCGSPSPTWPTSSTSSS